jgi:hypothetical protein
MVYNTQNDRVCGLFLMIRITRFQKMVLFPSSGEGRNTPTLLGPIERSNISHWTDTFSETLFFLII